MNNKTLTLILCTILFALTYFGVVVYSIKSGNYFFLMLYPMSVLAGIGASSWYEAITKHRRR